MFRLLFPSKSQSLPFTSLGQMSVHNSLTQIHALLNTLSMFMSQTQDGMEVIEAHSARAQESPAPPALVPPNAPSGNVAVSLPVAALSPLVAFPSVSPVHFISANIKRYSGRERERCESECHREQVLCLRGGFGCA